MCPPARGWKRWAFLQTKTRWLSNCFKVYLRNIETIDAQHAFALNDIHSQMANIAITSANLNDVVFIIGIEDMQMPELEDIGLGTCS